MSFAKPAHYPGPERGWCSAGRVLPEPPIPGLPTSYIAQLDQETALAVDRHLSGK
jgi:hypothetical protein